MGEGAVIREEETSGGAGVGETERVKGVGEGMMFLAERIEMFPIAMSTIVSTSKPLDKNSFL